MRTNIGYSGKVEIKVVKDKKTINTYTIKNTGTQLLFRGIALALIQNPNRNLLPNYIGVGSNGEQLRESSSLNAELTRVPISMPEVAEHKVLGDDGYYGSGYDAMFSATIPSTSISSSSTIKEIGLFGSASGNNLLARITTSTGEEIRVEPGMSLILQWTTHINNQNQ